MKVKKRVLLYLLILVGLFCVFMTFSEETVFNLETIVIANFDNPDSTQQWIVQGSKFVDKDILKYEYVNTWPNSLFGRNVETKDLHSLGIRAGFLRRGYNYLEIIPAIKGDDGKLVYKPIPLKGHVLSMDIWVWGSNYNYYLEAHILDSEGIPHTLNFGNLNFVGWKNLSAKVSLSIPQAKRHLLQNEQIRLTKFVLWTRPQEKVDEFYVYFDQLKILTDTYATRFDGDELADPNYIQKLWQNKGGDNQ
jgi:hypothetical protein